ncbi:hypothetical protein [Variovorax gracilis]|uniref:hypothetical protein n=1 Tax=Variovorax gracilis TaxID=3053502 RepID=UPI002576E45D|nr:hypothetical protein [Variovorax sp. J22R24]
MLAQIRGDDIARASNLLPPASAGEDTHATVEVDVPGIGRVRISFELHSSRGRRFRHWFWTATRAELA